MAWPEISIDDFPPARDDEPSSLRQDIIDELSDHFVCALNRELLKNPDESTAKQRVLNQFGDPIKIARQLWLDEMKEKIMSQRIMTGISAVMAVCCIAVVGIAWTLMKQSQAFNLQMLTQLQQAQNKSDTSTAGDMFNISFQLVQDTNEEQPAVGFTGMLTKVGEMKESFTIEAVSDQAGMLDFGKLPWGAYRLSLDAPWNEKCSELTVSMIPGRDFTQTIVCPAAPPVEVSVRFEVNWSEKMKSEDWFLLCDFRDFYRSRGLVNYRFDDVRSIQNKKWTVKQKRQGVYLVSRDNKIMPCPLSPEGEYLDFDPEKFSGQESIELNQGNYQLPRGYFIQANDLKQLSLLNRRQVYYVLNHQGKYSIVYGLKAHLSMGPNGGMPESSSTSILTPFAQLKPMTLKLNPAETLAENQVFQGIQLADLLEFTASKDQPDVWKIDLPDLNPVTLESGSSNSVP